MSSSECRYCFKSVQANLYGLKLDCNHWVHSGCLDKKNPDFNKCPECKGLITDAFYPGEASSLNGVDYVANPVSRNSLLKRGILKTAEPYNWLKEQKPLKWLIRDKQFGLQKMIEAGVTLDDLLYYGYEWKDIKQFKDFHQSPERARQALYALGCTAEHFRDHQEHFGRDAQKEFQINGKHMVELFGLQFAGNQMICAHGKNKKSWNATDLVTLGFTVQDLFGAGMETLDQYIALEPNDDDEKALGVTDEDLKMLPYSGDKVVEEPKQQQPIVVKVVVEQPKPEPVVEKILPPAAYISISKPRVHGLKNKK